MCSWNVEEVRVGSGVSKGERGGRRERSRGRSCRFRRLGYGDRVYCARRG